MNRLSFQMLSIVVLVLLSNSIAIGADFKIEKALWKAEKSLLIVKATADIGQRLRIENAYDSTQVLKESKLRKNETLTSRVRSPEQLPCRIRVVNLTTGHEVEQDVKSSDTKRVPEGCYPTSTPEPSINKAPVADAGVDQQMQLQAGQNSVMVTLDGSGSSDSDGTVADYIWTGSPDPADIPSPSIALSEGTHKLSLVVVDDQGESSASDTVLITVEPAPVEPPPVNEDPVVDTEPPANAAEAHASIVIYEGPSTCISCHEDEAVAMHGSVHYQQSGDTINLTNDVTPFSSSGLPRAGERGDGAIGINTYCGSHLNSPRFTCAGCHVGNGRFPNSELPLDETERQAELSNIDCLMCHQDTYKRFPSGDFEPLEIVEMGADGKPDPSLPPIVRTGSQGIPVVDPVTLDFEFEPADANSTLVDLGGSPMMQDRVSAAQSVHATTRKSCLNCHAKAGGGDGTKRGDLSSALIDPAPSIDIHMSSSGENLSCADCHDAGGHRVKGRGLDLRPNDVPEHFTCESCHDQPHGDYSNRNGGSRDKHATRVACQTCHIPTYAKGVPTETNRDWEDPHFSAAACNGRGGWLPREDKALNLTPTYHWFDGTSQVYVLGEDLADYPVTVLEDGSDAITLGQPNGWVNKQNAKIYPMKEHTSKSAVHDASNSLIAHSTFEFFRTGSFDTAVQHALEQTGRSGDSYSVKKVHTFQTLNHGVEDSSAALECGACHASLSGGPLRMDLANDLGYGMKGKEAEVCTQCHENKGSMSFTKVHEKHVKDKGIDCSTCHEFSRPERGLNANVAQFVED
ncbi:MAG: hypothetical protein K1566_16345 [Candidatus Thiodiazotropha sp. (ex. Lucinisca nassula)]|nr:hypothetical protein [Candidatus Thiodiazotropha sp. (ex. Lucinisca nassula)]MBW9262289.1 hypothetical protein [Candidatus Thiodiazotropha sp. (ex. Lucinisca nassula)]MBW9271211.1 hypothetical protein [Candidatus Thiodiazotropha sp. (ex. Lucinisca nassula)]